MTLHCYTIVFSSKIDSLEAGHPFLKYASIHWISHTENFQETVFKIWKWEIIISSSHSFAQRPCNFTVEIRGVGQATIVITDWYGL